MITIQTGMLVALGCFIASLVWLLLASAFWSRAVRLTTDRLKRSMPISEAEIKADRDRLRAEHAIKVHSIEKRLDQARLERARHLIDINRRDARISALETEIAAIRAGLEENQNARRVLEQTIADRLPKVEARLGEAKRLLFNRDREIAELSQGAKRHKQALEEASSINAQNNAEIERLNSALVSRGRGRNGADRREGAAAGQAEVETLRAKTREQAALIDRLQRRLSQGYVVPGATPPATDADDPGADALHETLSEAEAALQAARTQPEAMVAGASTRDRDQEVARLNARLEDQAGEIARLRATLVALEQTTPGGGLKDSKLALKARAGSAEAQAERQGATITKLRAELAAANERLARQAAHFMDEMRRLGAPSTNGAGAARHASRNGQVRKLADRVAQIRPALADKLRSTAAAPAGAATNGAENAGDQSGGTAQTPASATEKTPEPALAVASADAPSAAEMPQTAAIPEEGRKLRLLDRITSLSKG